MLSASTLLPIRVLESKMKSSFARIAMVGALSSLAALTVQDAYARGGGGGFGGGGRGGGGGFGGGGRGGSMSMSHGGGGGTGFSRGGSYSRPGGDNRPGQLPATRPGQGGAGTRWNGSADINRNVNYNRNVNVNVNNRYGYGWAGGWHDYPLARGVAIGAVAGITAAAIGSTYYALPPACSPYDWQGYTYYTCGGAFYRPQYQGDTIVYVVVPSPQ
jgi:hypothetical protein